MIRREFLRKLAIGGGAAAALPAALGSRARGEREQERTRFLAQLSDMKKQLAQLEKSHKLLFRALLVALSLSVGVDLASIL